MNVSTLEQCVANLSQAQQVFWNTASFAHMFCGTRYRCCMHIQPLVLLVNLAYTRVLCTYVYTSMNKICVHLNINIFIHIYIYVYIYLYLYLCNIYVTYMWSSPPLSYTISIMLLEYISYAVRFVWDTKPGTFCGSRKPKSFDPTLTICIYI